MASEFLTVARQVLERQGQPLRAKEIVSSAIQDGLFSDKRAGKTPHQTMKSKLSVHIRRYGESSEFVRTAPGFFYLRSLLKGVNSYRAKPIAKAPSRESVLVFDAAWFPEDVRFQGIMKSPKRLFKRLLEPHVCQYLPRLQAEGTEAFKQVLTYVMVTRNDSVLVYKRGNYNRVEDYLRGAHCVGFGGHVTNRDRTLFSDTGMGVWEAAARELNEELSLPRQDQAQLRAGVGLNLVGMLNDDSSSTGRKHIAFLFRYETAPDAEWSAPARGEKSITQLRWLSSKEEPPPLWDFEYWSQLCLREFFPSLVRATPSFRIRRKKALQAPHILCVVGTVGSGKSEATRLLREDFGYHEINSGKVMARLMGIPPIPTTSREFFQKRAWDFIQSDGGPSRLAHEIAREAKRQRQNLLLVDGIRQQATVDALCRELADRRVVILYVEAPPDLAFSLYRQRERESATFTQFNALRHSPVEHEVPGMIGKADAVLYNWFGIPAYRRTIREMMSQWKAV